MPPRPETDFESRSSSAKALSPTNFNDDDDDDYDEEMSRWAGDGDQRPPLLRRKNLPGRALEFFERLWRRIWRLVCARLALPIREVSS